jgi:predicted enzyme related to lactoylglutathione lyase
MGLSIQCIDIAAADPQALATFWASALGWRRTHDSQDEVALEPPEHSWEEGVAPDLLFLRADDPKVGNNRLHLDLRPGDQAAEVERLEALGATTADVGQRPDSTWVVMRDPEGNEFCVLRAFTPGERAQVDAIRNNRART